MAGERELWTIEDIYSAVSQAKQEHDLQAVALTRCAAGHSLSWRQAALL